MGRKTWSGLVLPARVEHRRGRQDGGGGVFGVVDGRGKIWRGEPENPVDIRLYLVV